MRSLILKAMIQLTDTAYQFTAGVLKNARGFTAVCNPIVNSYKRLHQVTKHHVILHGVVKPLALVRVPTSRGSSTRIEVRSVDPAANRTWH